MEQRQRGTLQICFEPFVALRAPKLFNLRTDPFERADVTSNTYWDWFMDHIFLVVPAQREHRQRLPGNIPGVPASPEGSQLHH
jgi:hypothetical protein